MGESLSGVGVLDKAVSILVALEGRPLSLHDLTVETALPRATAHRLAIALERHGLVDRDASGRYVLGSALARLGRAAGHRPPRSLVEAAGPALLALRDTTGESAQLYVTSAGPAPDGQEGVPASRVCVASLESLHSLRTIVAVGAILPMDRGSAAKVLAGDHLALTRGWAQSVEEREKGVASVSAPVVIDGRVIAAVSVSGPVERTSRQPGRRYAGPVTAAARAVEAALAQPADT